MDAYFILIAHLVATDPVPAAVAIISLAGRLAAIHFGIRAAAAARPMPRSDYILFAILYSVLTFIAGGCILMIGAGFGMDTGAVLLAGLLSPVAYYFLAQATARRLADIGWSRNWTWLLVILGDALLFMLLLCLVPGNTRAATAQA